MASSARRSIILMTAVLAVAGAAWGARRAMRSPMFLLQVVEVADQPEDSPVDAETISRLAALSMGRINLFDLDLKPVEERILSNPWIREVRLQKNFPQTLSISVSFREPQAIMQSEAGTLSYVDAEGNVFGQVSLQHQPDLPLISPSGAEHVHEALQLLRAWNSSGLAQAAHVSTLQWDPERGFRVLVTYPIESTGARGRTFVDLGQDIDGDAQFSRLGKVFQYLSSNRVQARQIWADSGKKVVVRTVHGS